ncbi:MAG: hypothetical protein ACKV2Q_25295 [Planctomycetaceae bacterium]
MELTIHQLYCTHCTFGTSYLHQRTTGAVKDQSFEYSARAGSMAREKSHDYFRQIEPYLYYHLPGDLPGDQVLKHDAASTSDWRRFVYLPSVGGMQVLAWVCYRTTDTQDRPGSYFAHVLLFERTNDEQAWSAAEALRLWGSPNWVVRDADFPTLELKAVRSLDEFRTSGPRTPRMIDDQVLLSFLTAPTGTPFDDPGQLIPARWKQKSPGERRELLIDTLQGFLELNFERRQTMLLAIEPCLAALIFYGVARLLPKTGMGEKLSFSTFESHEQRPPTALAATTFIDVENSDLPRDPSQSRGFAINTFKPLEKSPPLSWKQRKDPPQYARKLVDLLVDRGTEAVAELLLAFEKAGAVSKDDLEELIQADAFSDAFLAGDSASAAARLKTLREPATKYLRQTVQGRLAKIISRSGPSITAAPPPPHPRGQAPQNSELAERRVDSTGSSIPPILNSVVPDPGQVPSAVPTTSQGSAELRQITEQPARVLDILKLIAAEDATADAQSVVKKLLTAYVEHGRDQFDRLLRTEGLAKSHKRYALRVAVERHQQIPTGCEWLWTETKAVSGQPALLTTLLLDLDDASVKGLLTGFLETQPPSDKVSPVCDALAQASQTQDTKRGLLVAFVDHPQLPPATLLSALRMSASIRKPVFEQYAKFRQDQPQRDFRLPGLLEGSVERLTNPADFPRLLDLLNDGRPLLWNEAAAQVGGWMKIRKLFEEIKNLLADEPSLWSRLRGNINDAKLQELGMKLAEESRRAMPDKDKRFEADHKGQERCDILESIGEQLLKPRALPYSFWRKLLSAMSGNGWQILSSAPRTRRRKSAKSELLGQLKPFIPAAIALLVVAAAIWAGSWLFQTVFSSSVLAQLTSLPKEQQVEAFLKLPEEQFVSLMDDPELLSENSVAFSINDRLTSFEKLSDQRSENWRYKLWPKLSSEKRVDLLLKLPPKELKRQLEGLTRDGQGPLLELFDSKETSAAQLTALARQLDKKQLQLLLSNREVERRVEVLAGFERGQLMNLDLSIKTSLTTDELARLARNLTSEQLEGLLLDIPENPIKQLLEQFEQLKKTELIAKLKKASPLLIGRLQRSQTPVQTASNSKPKPPMPPATETKTPPAEVSPKVTPPTPAPVNPVVVDDNPNTLRFEGGAGTPLVAYRALPEYPLTKDEAKEGLGGPPTVWELPKSLEPFTAIRLRGLDEHEKWFRDMKRPIPKTIEEENGKKLRVVLGPETPSKTLCTFEFQAPNRLAFEWVFQSDESVRLQDAVRSCVLEIERGKQPELYVSLIPYKLVEKPLRFGSNGICSLTSSLKECHLSSELGSSLQLGEGAIHLVAKQGHNAGEKFPFETPPKATGRVSSYLIPQLDKRFGLTDTAVRLNPIGEGMVSAETPIEIVLVSSPTLSKQQQADDKVLGDRLSRLEQAKLTLTVAKNRLNAKNKPPMKSDDIDTKKAETAHNNILAVLKIIGLDNSKLDPTKVEYTTWAVNEVLPRVLTKIEALKREQAQLKGSPQKVWDEFLNSELVVSGVIYRVVGGEIRNGSVTGGIVVKALELRPVGIVESKDKPK